MKNVSAPDTGFSALLNGLNVPVPKGPLKGMCWLLRSGGKLLRVLEGSYEPEQTQSFLEEIKKDGILFDIGSHVGWYTLLTSKIVSQGKVVAFEASPRNYWFLSQHVARNKLSNVITVHNGVSDSIGVMYFEAGSGTGTGRLAQSGSVQVPTISVDEYIKQSGLTPTHMKIDVEGGEMAVLRGARNVLETHAPLIFLSTHGKEIKQECIDYLAALGYQFEVMHEDKPLDAVADFICRKA